MPQKLNSNVCVCVCVCVCVRACVRAQAYYCRLTVGIYFDNDGEGELSLC